jgi:hypothetical protein
MAEGSPSILHVSLSRFQTIIGLLAGLVSVFGAVYSVPQFFKPAPGMGEVVALVQEAKSEKAVAGATIEILTAQNALVTTLTPDSLGPARRCARFRYFRDRRWKFECGCRPVLLLRCGDCWASNPARTALSRNARRRRISSRQAGA